MEEKKKDRLEDLKEKLKECQKLKDEYLAGWQRSRADFLNYKKEAMERISEILEYGKEEFILKILPVLDSFDRAIKEVQSMKSKEKELVKGFLQIKEQLKNFLQNQGLKEIECEGKKFNPNFHEVIEEVESSKESGTIIEEVEKGYKLHGKVIRPARVKITKPKKAKKGKKVEIKVKTT